MLAWFSSKVESHHSAPAVKSWPTLNPHISRVEGPLGARRYGLLVHWAARLVCSVGSGSLPMAPELLGTMGAGQGSARSHIHKDVRWRHCQLIQCCAHRQLCRVGSHPTCECHLEAFHQRLDKMFAVSVSALACAAMPMFLAHPSLLCRQIVLHSGHPPDAHGRG